jgi:hypothetical protein
MEFNYIADGIDAVVIDNFYTEEQLKEIMLELKWLTKKSILVGEDELESARLNGELLASKRGIFLEHVFKNWKHSALISHGITQTTDKQFIDGLYEYSTLFKSLIGCNSRSHLLSYYENSNYYKPHKDGFFYTILNYFYVEPKQFEGGEVILHSCNSDKIASIEVKHNRAIVIASQTMHEVKEIKSSLDNILSGKGRYCNAMFFTYDMQRDRDAVEFQEKMKKDGGYTQGNTK